MYRSPARTARGDYYDCPIYVNHELAPNRKRYITEELTDYAVDFVNKDRTGPFCLYLSHKAVHHDWRPPEDLKGKYKDADLSFLAPESDKYNTWTGLNWLEGTMGNMHGVYRRYCECLESVDRNIGRLLDALTARGLLDNTIIVYAGDNGYMWGEHRMYAKHYPYEESIRIPYIVRAPMFTDSPGRRADQMVLNMDLAPSLLRAAGLDIPSEMQGAKVFCLFFNRPRPKGAKPSSTNSSETSPLAGGFRRTKPSAPGGTNTSTGSCASSRNFMTWKKTRARCTTSIILLKAGGWPESWKLAWPA